MGKIKNENREDKMIREEKVLRNDKVYLVEKNNSKYMLGVRLIEKNRQLCRRLHTGKERKTSTRKHNAF